MTTTKRQQGFSLIELLIVVAIIGIIAAIAIPNLLASRRAANEGSALASMRVLTSAEATYQSTKGAGYYGSLADLNGAGLIDSVLSGSTPGSGTPKSGFYFDANAIAGSQAYFDCTSAPSSFGGLSATGTRSFYTNETGVMYFNTTGTAPTADAATRVVTGGTPLQ